VKDPESFEELDTVVWAHIEAERFDQAEVALRKLIDLIHPEDALRLNMFFSLLGGVLNRLDRADEGTEMYRRALIEARRLGPSRPEVGAARYMLANQYLLYGDPALALAETEPVPSGSGHVQCLLHAVAAQALWKLGRHDEARVAARKGLTASPTDERRAQLSQELDYILGSK
jgi:tetratricopeptide (TPR) repeat protein